MKRSPLAVIKYVSCLALYALLTAMAAMPLASGSIPGAVEDAVRYSNTIVLGRVTHTEPQGISAGPMKQLVTQHRFSVESYFKGSGPDEITLLTMGGMEMRQVGGETQPVYTQALGSQGVRVGEQFLAFLKSVPEGYFFVLNDGAKYLVEENPEGTERSITLRLRKLRNMQGSARSQFENLAQSTDPELATTGELRLGKFLGERIPVKDLSDRLQLIIQGEAVPTR